MYLSIWSLLWIEDWISSFLSACNLSPIFLPQAQTKSIRYKVVTILFRRSGMFLDSPRIDTFSRNDSYSFLFLMVLPCETKKEERLHKKQSKETNSVYSWWHELECVWVSLTIKILRYVSLSIAHNLQSVLAWGRKIGERLQAERKDDIQSTTQRPDGQIHDWTERHNTLDWDKHKWSDRYMNRWSDGLFTWSDLRSDDRYMI